MIDRDSGRRRALALVLATSMAAAFEGVRQVAYFDPVGILTVCYGQTRDVEPTRVYTLAECRSRLDADMAAAIDDVERCAPGLPEKPLAALGDAVYNIGAYLVCDPARSTLAGFLQAGRLTDACNELPRWDKARIAGFLVPLPGLAKRRRLERSYCLDLIG